MSVKSLLLVFLLTLSFNGYSESPFRTRPSSNFLKEKVLKTEDIVKKNTPLTQIPKMETIQYWKTLGDLWFAFLQASEKKKDFDLNSLIQMVPNSSDWRDKFNTIKKSTSLIKTQEESLNLISSYLEPLEERIKENDQEAISLAFRLLSLADGHFAEELSVMIGKVIQIDAEKFLKEMDKKIKDDKIFQDFMNLRIGGLICNLGDDFIDQPKTSSRKKEVEGRIKNIQRIKDKNLKLTKQRVIESLKNCSGQLKESGL